MRSRWKLECGVDEKDVTVTLANGIMKMKGEKKQEKEEKAASYHLTSAASAASTAPSRLPEDHRRCQGRGQVRQGRVTAAKKPEAVEDRRKIEIKKS